MSVDYAGSIDGRIRDVELASLARDGGAFLTKSSVQINDPGAIASDFEFGQAPNDDPFQQVEYRDKDVQILPYVILGGGLLFVAGARCAEMEFQVVSRLDLQPCFQSRGELLPSAPG